jgi:hypothetical protein
VEWSRHHFFSSFAQELLQALDLFSYRAATPLLGFT